MYRFHKEKYNNQLFSNGEIRIGTLYTYRNTELNKGIADKDEGKKIVNYQFSQNAIIGGKYNNKENIDFQAAKLFSAVYADETSTIYLGDAKTSQNLESKNYYILCLAKNIDAKFEDYDSCLEIISESFFEELTIVINKQTPVKYLGCFEVKYQSREENWNKKDFGIHPCLIKENKEEYVQQKEIRAIWEPINENIYIEPIFVKSLELCKYLKKVNLEQYE